MRIYGLQKMTLLDFPGRVACTVFTGGCNLRCPYCHNYELVSGQAPPAMTEDELFAFLRQRAGKLDGVAVTGGEPCLHPDLPAFLRAIRALGYPVKLDTNGAYPDRLAEILQDGLADYVAMDIKSGPTRYALAAGLEHIDLAPIRRSVRLLMSSGVDYEFRTTVVDELHTAADFEEIAAWIHGAKRYFLQSFTDRDTVPFDGLHAPDRDTLSRYLDIVSPHVALAALRGVE